MKDTHILESVVPIYYKDSFWGTGFIYKSYLITAAHVVIGNEGISYLYRGKPYHLNVNDRVCYALRGGERNEHGIIPFDPDAEDLAIYTIETPCHEISIFGQDVQDRTDAILYGFHCKSKNNISLKRGMVRMYSEIDLDIVPFLPQSYCQYCKKQDEKLHVIKGYSGGPLLVGNTVVGMLIEGMIIDGYYHIMKSKRILNRINDYEQDAN